MFTVKHKQGDIFWQLIFFFFSFFFFFFCFCFFFWTCCWATEMIHLNENFSTLAQKMYLQNSLQQSFINLSKLRTLRYISEERGYRRNFDLVYDLVSAIYQISQPLKAHFYLKSIYDLIFMRADQPLLFSMSS